MGYAKSAIIKVDLADPNYWVMINWMLPVGRARDYRKELYEVSKDDPDGKQPETAIDRTMVMLHYAVIDWNVDDDEGHILPVTRENMAVLDLEDSRIIINKFNEERKTKTIQEEASFLLPPTPGSEDSTEQPPPSVTKTSSLPSSSGNISVFPITEETVMSGTPKPSKSGSNSSD